MNDKYIFKVNSILLNYVIPAIVTLGISIVLFSHMVAIPHKRAI